MVLNRGQIFKPVVYQPIYTCNKPIISSDPLVNLTLLINNYSKDECIKTYQHQLDILFTNVFGLFREHQTTEKEINYHKSVLKMYIDTFVTNVGSISINEKAQYHFRLLLEEISDDIDLRSKKDKKKEYIREWIKKKKSIEALERMSPFEEKVLTFELIEKPEETDSLIKFYSKAGIIITVMIIIILFLATF